MVSLEIVELRPIAKNGDNEAVKVRFKLVLTNSRF